MRGRGVFSVDEAMGREVVHGGKEIVAEMIWSAKEVMGSHTDTRVLDWTGKRRGGGEKGGEGCKRMVVLALEIKAKAIAEGSAPPRSPPKENQFY